MKLFGRVDSAMFVEVAFLSKLLSTIPAFIWLFATMHPHMINKVPAFVELLISVFILAQKVPDCPA
jgi:hypothetical protein